MTQQTTFVQSGTPITAAPQELSTTVAMPTVDGSNVDLLVTYNGEQPCFLTFAPAVAVGSGLQRGEVQVPPNTPLLLTNAAATLAAGAANPLIVQSPNHATASTVSIIAGMRGGTLSIQRGTATSRYVF